MNALPTRKTAAAGVEKAAKKSSAKKAVKAAKKAPAKKAAKKAPAKKAAAKKAPAEKAAKKSGPKKSTAKKSAAKKSATTTSRATGTSKSTSAPTRPALAAPPTDPLIVLGLQPDFTLTQLRRAWRDHAAIHHPDAGGDAATFARGRHAYETLREAVRR